MARILSVGPDREILADRNRALAQRGHYVHSAATRTDAVVAAVTQPFDVALVCNSFPKGYASAFARDLQALMPRSAVVFILSAKTGIIAEIEEMIQEFTIPPRAA